MKQNKSLLQRLFFCLPGPQGLGQARGIKMTKPYALTNPISIIRYAAKLLRPAQDENMNAGLIDFPAEDRLLETRKIMHKDLHRH
jgi:hypothetical protein